MSGLTALGLLLCLAGCVCIYLASPNQRLRGRPLPPAPARVAAAALLVIGLAALFPGRQGIVAAFLFATWVMLVLVLLPYLGAWLALRRVR